MIPFEQVREWLYEHGYRDQYPRRDAGDPTVLSYTFVREGRRRVVFPTRGSEVKPGVFAAIKAEVLSHEQGK